MILGIPFFISRITRYEFWPFWLFYIPMYFYGLYLALKAGSLTYFTAANPVMKYGGAFDVPKYDILSLINRDFTPISARIHPDVKMDELSGLIKESGGYLRLN